MEVTIRYTDGPLAGQSVTLDEGSKRILFGRDPGVCQVVFPADATQVGRRHCAMTLMVDDYRLGIFQGYLVTVDGRPARDGQRLHSGAICQLGPDGPKFVVEYGRGRGMATTMSQIPIPPKKKSSWLPRILRRDKKKE